MPIQFPDFRRLTREEVSPIPGMQSGQQMMQNYMMFPEQLKEAQLLNAIKGVQAKYAPQMAEQALTKAQQENIWNPKIWQSEIGLRGAQADKYSKETEWYDREAKARIAREQAEATSKNTENTINQIKLRYLQNLQKGFNPQPNNGQGMGQVGAGGTTGAPIASDEGSKNLSPSNSSYGIENPVLTQNDIANKMFFGIDTYSPRQENATKQQQDQYTQYQKKLGETIQQANGAMKAKQVLAIFNNAMDKTGLKGAFWGTTPSEGWRTMYHPDESVQNAQIADTAVANILPGAITELREAMRSGQFSVADLNAASRMKVSRTMGDEARATQTAWLNGIYDRFDEKSKFYSAMANPGSGATSVVADQLWEQYQRDFPLISDDGKTYLGGNIGNWPLYTTPRAISSIKNTGVYKPSRAEKNTFMMQLPGGEVVPIKKGKVESAFRKGAKPL